MANFEKSHLSGGLLIFENENFSISESLFEDYDYLISWQSKIELVQEPCAYNQIFALADKQNRRINLFIDFLGCNGLGSNRFHEATAGPGGTFSLTRKVLVPNLPLNEQPGFDAGLMHWCFTEQLRRFKMLSENSKLDARQLYLLVSEKHSLH